MQKRLQVLEEFVVAGGELEAVLHSRFHQRSHVIGSVDNSSRCCYRLTIRGSAFSLLRAELVCFGSNGGLAFDELRPGCPLRVS
jgi:hypothetical protein